MVEANMSGLARLLGVVEDAYLAAVGAKVRVKGAIAKMHLSQGPSLPSRRKNGMRRRMSCRRMSYRRTSYGMTTSNGAVI
jgi:hypothetical protein